MLYQWEMAIIPVTISGYDPKFPDLPPGYNYPSPLSDPGELPVVGKDKLGTFSVRTEKNNNAY